MGILLDGYPYWSQLTDVVAATGRPDIFATTDCGEETVSIWIMGKKRQYTTDGQLRMQLPGSRTDGRTTPEDLVFLLAKYGIPAQATHLHPKWVREAVKQSIGLYEPIALLGNWLQPSTLHWILGVGYGNDSLIAMEPWKGQLTTYRWGTVYSLATGDVVQHT